MGICSRIRRWRLARCRASMSTRLLSRREGLGRWGYRTPTGRTPRTSPNTYGLRRQRRVSPNISTSTCMNAALPDFRDEELLASTVADLIGDVRHVAVG